MIILAIKLASAFLLGWWATVTLMIFARGHSIPMLNFMIVSASAVAFAWSMGWLS